MREEADADLDEALSPVVVVVELVSEAFKGWEDVLAS